MRIEIEKRDIFIIWLILAGTTDYWKSWSFGDFRKYVQDKVDKENETV